MHRNTYLLLIFLAIAAAIVTGVNLTRRPEQQAPPPTTLLTPTVSQPKIYELTGCGISFPTPADHTALEGPGTNVVFTAKTGGDTIIVTCQKNIPRPPLAADKIDRLAFDLPGEKPTTVAAALYHDTQARNGAPIDKLIFTNPRNGLDIFISGTGASFQSLIRNLSILQ
ncbi:hypothetical protein HY086_00320 [Candidatus Gottesmanbacteria bacterium]|nr:hypothetical protein [Candidatus Gottesmanbacteria bacterium]